MTHNIPSAYGEFAYGWSESNPDSEQMKPAERQLGGDTLCPLPPIAGRGSKSKTGEG